MRFNFKIKLLATFISTSLLLLCNLSLFGQETGQYTDIVPCERTMAGSCTTVGAYCSFRNNTLGEEFSGKCKNREGDNICHCSIFEDTSEGCTFYLGGPQKGGCYNPEQECTYQGSGPGDPDRGQKGVCVTREQINITTLEKERTCVCNAPAVCGDERVDKDQGEKCDPPGLPTDGCEDTGGSCSEDCRRCIPPEQPPTIF